MIGDRWYISNGAPFVRFHSSDGILVKSRNKLGRPIYLPTTQNLSTSILIANMFDIHLNSAINS